MPLTSIVVIVVRLFSLYWLVEGLTSSVVVASMTTFSYHTNYWNYGPPAAYLVAAVLTWLNAPLISRLVTPRPDSTVNVGGLTRHDLYCFAFVFLSLYFILGFIGQALDWIYHLGVTAKHAPENDPARESEFYQLTQSVIPVLAGVFCIAMSSRLAKRLVAAQRKDEEGGLASRATKE